LFKPLEVGWQLPNFITLDELLLIALEQKFGARLATFIFCTGQRGSNHNPKTISFSASLAVRVANAGLGVV
jgi:hypothetical protein